MGAARATWRCSDTAVIRAAIVAVTGPAPSDWRTLRERAEARTGIEIGERRFYRALRWAIAQGLVRKIRPETWRDEGGYVRVMGRAAVRPFRRPDGCVRAPDLLVTGRGRSISRMDEQVAGQAAGVASGEERAVA